MADRAPAFCPAGYCDGKVCPACGAQVKHMIVGESYPGPGPVQWPPDRLPFVYCCDHCGTHVQPVAREVSRG